MCGRFSQTLPLNELCELYDLTYEGEVDFATSANIFPKQSIYGFGPKHVLRKMYWGLIPAWWRKPLTELPKTYNARSETLEQKPMFRQVFQKQRCIIPASGFYEWSGPPGDKKPWFIEKANGAPLAFAGLFDKWADPSTKQPLLSATIITVEANDIVGDIHHRMPAILSNDDIETWLDGPDKSLLKPCPSSWLKLTPA